MVGHLWASGFAVFCGEQPGGVSGAARVAGAAAGSAAAAGSVTGSAGEAGVGLAGSALAASADLAACFLLEVPAAGTACWVWRSTLRLLAAVSASAIKASTVSADFHRSKCSSKPASFQTSLAESLG